MEFKIESSKNNHRFTALPYFDDCCFIVDLDAADVAQCENCKGLQKVHDDSILDAEFILE